MTEDPTRRNLLEAKKDSIHPLQQLYSVVIALALTHAILKIGEVLPSVHSTEPIFKLTAIAVAFLSTLVPFYHGMNRHLYVAHIKESKKHKHPVPLLIDIFVFIIESGLLFAMGRKMDDPTDFLWLWVSLLIVDIVWSIIVWKFQDGEKPRWAVNNLIWLIIVLLGYFVVPRVFQNTPSALASYGVYLLAVAEVCRSIVDYKINWNFYFPWANLKSTNEADIEIYCALIFRY